jgi:N6-L-threonylcarbamoyladenine synthase
MIDDRPFRVLGIETSCDETAAAVVADGRIVMSDIVASQADLHSRYGGVVPEIASRLHVESIVPVVQRALSEAGVRLDELDGIAVTCGPGLVGALLVGVSAAKGLASVSNLPLVGVHHVAGHIAANYLSSPNLSPPFVCLVASGGHSHIVLVREPNRFEILARTRDDAAGEAFDKIARAMGLGYPGGPAVDLESEGGRMDAVSYPRMDLGAGSLDFSFSGVKTHALNSLNRLKMTAAEKGVDVWSLMPRRDFAASFQSAVVDALIDHAFSALERSGLRVLALAGGVSANRELRRRMQLRAEREGVTLHIPPLRLCTDNAAMIAAAGTFALRAGQFDGMDLNADPSWELGVEC